MSTKAIIFLVDGNCVPKQSYRAVKGGGYTSPRVRAWQDTVALRAREAMAGREPIPGPVSIRCVFVLKHKRRVDLGNLEKCIEDALNGIAYLDDCQIVNAHLVKHVYPKAEPGVYIEVHEGTLLPFMQEWKL